MITATPRLPLLASFLMLTTVLVAGQAEAQDWDWSRFGQQCRDEFGQPENPPRPSTDGEARRAAEAFVPEDRRDDLQMYYCHRHPDTADDFYVPRRAEATEIVGVLDGQIVFRRATIGGGREDHNFTMLTMRLMRTFGVRWSDDGRYRRRGEGRGGVVVSVQRNAVYMVVDVGRPVTQRRTRRRGRR